MIIRKIINSEKQVGWKLNVMLGFFITNFNIYILVVVGSPSEYGKPRNLDYGQQTASTSRQSSVLSALQERNSEMQSKRNAKIPRPPNAFMIFANEWRRKLAYDHPCKFNCMLWQCCVQS